MPTTREKDEQLKKKMNKQLMRKTDYNQHTHRRRRKKERKNS
jgi:hypothetical protein